MIVYFSVLCNINIKQWNKKIAHLAQKKKNNIEYFNIIENIKKFARKSNNYFKYNKNKNDRPNFLARLESDRLRE